MLTDINERVDPSQEMLGLKSVGLVESVRTVDGKTTVETRYYISSLSIMPNYLGNQFEVTGVENSLHWVLDVALSEDDCRIRKDNAPENFAVMRRLAVNLLGREKKQKRKE